MGKGSNTVRKCFSLRPETVRDMERFALLCERGGWSRKVDDMINGFMKTAKENPTLIEAYGYRLG